MSNQYLGDEDLIYNTTTRIPIVICLDISHSMNMIVSNGTSDLKVIGQEFRDGQLWNLVEGGNDLTLFKKVENGINLVYDSIRNSEQASSSAEISIVTFSDRAEIYEDFSTIDQKNNFDQRRINFGNSTNMAAGVQLALKTLDERKQKYKMNGIDYYQPWLLLFTDGNPTDSVYDVQKFCMDLQKQNKLTVYTFALNEDVNIENLKGFSKINPIRLKEEKFEQFFEFLGKSISMVTENQDSANLDLTNLSDWADI